MDLVSVLEVALEKTLSEWTRCVMTFKKRKELNRALAEDVDKLWRIVGPNVNGRTCHRRETQKLAEDQMWQAESNGKGGIYPGRFTGRLGPNEPETAETLLPAAVWW